MGFKMVKLDESGTLSDEMANLLAAANGDRKEQSESKLIRDKAFTHLKELMDGIREAGKYLFWRNPERYKGYISQYRRKHRSKEEEPENAV